jgi:hypothetical protein
MNIDAAIFFIALFFIVVIVTMLIKHSIPTVLLILIMALSMSTIKVEFPAIYNRIVTVPERMYEYVKAWEANEDKKDGRFLTQNNNACSNGDVSLQLISIINGNEIPANDACSKGCELKLTSSQIFEFKGAILLNAAYTTTGDSCND